MMPEILIENLLKSLVSQYTNGLKLYRRGLCHTTGD
jgi:hypothetical protein